MTNTLIALFKKCGDSHIANKNLCRKYTKPKLRERLKIKILKSAKGGKANQWSARKSQLLALEYRRRGGGYRGGLSAKAKSLIKWTNQQWSTSDSKPAIREGKTTRYLPADAWRKLSPGQRRATNAKKITGSKNGRQFISNTKTARKVVKKINQR